MRRLIVFVGCAAAVVCSAAYAQGSATSEVKAIDDRVSTLETRMRAGEAGDVPAWVQKIRFSGDFRYRHEWIDIEDVEDRHRHRIRARLQMNATVTDELEVVIGLATGSCDPVSTNQDLGDVFSSKSINLDLAYVTYTPEQVAGLAVVAGKMPNPLHRPQGTELIWDDDMRPEGIAVAYKTEDLAEGLEAFVNAGGLWVDEMWFDSDMPNHGQDVLLWVVQGGLEFDIPDQDLYVNGGAGYYHYDSVQGAGPLSMADALGNTLVADDPLDPFDDAEWLESEFHLWELFLEFGGEIAVNEDDQIKFAVFGDYVQNADAESSEDQGWMLGGMLNWQGWTLEYNYRDLEADAVLGALTDSDFIGGGTDGKGHEIGLCYDVTEHVKVAATLFLNEIERGSTDLDYDRGQLDFLLMF